MYDQMFALLPSEIQGLWNEMEVGLAGARCVVCQKMHEEFSDYCPKCSDQIQRDYEEIDRFTKWAECDGCGMSSRCQPMYDGEIYVMDLCKS